MKNFRRRLVRALLGERFYKIYRLIKDRKDIVEEPNQSTLGFLFAGNQAMKNGEFEPVETELFKAVIEKVDVVINVGANVGYYCCLALSSGKPIVAYEPIQRNLQYLLNNIEANNWGSKAEVIPVALSNNTGIIKIYGEGTGASLIRGWANAPDQEFTLVPCTTINNSIGKRFKGKRCLVLVDVEGAELYMLQGASDLLIQNPKPIWMVEVSITEHQPNGIAVNQNLMSTFQIFQENGYEAWTADIISRKISLSEIKSIIDSGLDTINTHNFFFIEDGKRGEYFEA